MSKKARILLIILPCVSLFVAVIVFSILSMFTNELFGNENSMLTVYEGDYYATTKFWWIYLAFLPFCILSLALGSKRKDRIVSCVSIVIMMVMIMISFVNFKDAKQYSTSDEYLTLIEDTVKYDFHEDTTILVDKTMSSKKSNIICEGNIRIPTYEENITDLENNIVWKDQIDIDIENKFSERFKFCVSSSDKLAYTIVF